jgi:hypothetical protein
MKITNNNVSIKYFNTWSGATSTQKTIINEGKADGFDALIEELYPDGMTETELNDLLWFEEDWIFEQLGISTDEEE